MTIKIMGSYLIIIHFPGGPLIMRDESRDEDDPPICLFKTFEDARTAALGNRAAQAYGAEAFEVGSGYDLI